MSVRARARTRRRGRRGRRCYRRLVDPDAVRRWKAGLELAAERSIEEARAVPIAERVEQLVVMMRSAQALGWATTDPAEVEVVRARFVRLHRLLGAR